MNLFIYAPLKISTVSAKNISCYSSISFVLLAITYKITLLSLIRYYRGVPKLYHSPKIVPYLKKSENSPVFRGSSNIQRLSYFRVSSVGWSLCDWWRKLWAAGVPYLDIVRSSVEQGGRRFCCKNHVKNFFFGRKVKRRRNLYALTGLQGFI